MSQKKRGKITLACGIVCIVSSVVLLVLRLLYGGAVVGGKEIVLSVVWAALGTYFCWIGRKQQKSDK